MTDTFIQYGELSKNIPAMSTYKSKEFTIDSPASVIYDKITDLGSFESRLDQLPPEVRQKLGDVRFGEDSISINAAPMGEVRFRVTERIAPERVTLAAEQSPVPLTLSVTLRPTLQNPDATDVQTVIDVDIPPMLRPMVGGKLQEAANKFGELLHSMFH